MKKILSAKISLASHGDTKNRGFFNCIDLKNPIKKLQYNSFLVVDKSYSLQTTFSIPDVIIN